MRAAVSVNGVSKHFRLYHERYSTLKERILHFGRQRHEAFWALRDVSLDIREGETVGLIGANGSGKTTLLNIIAGIIRPSSGTVQTQGRVAALLELGAGFHPDLTGRENVYMNASILGLSRKETNRYFDSIVSFAELEPFIDNQVKHYSSGMYVRLGFAVAVHVDPRILLVDEVLAVGDEAFQRKCLDRVREFQREGRTIIFVTHAVDVVRDICNRAAFLHHGELVAAGDTGEVVRRFRETIHGEAHLEAAPMQERGTREALIRAVRLTDRGGVEKQTFLPSDELVVEVDVEFPRPIDDPVVGIGIYDERDLLVFGTNTALDEVSLGSPRGTLRVRFGCRRMPILGGRYRLTVGVHSRDGRTTYHWQEKMYVFQCVKTSRHDGYVDFIPEVFVTQLRDERVPAGEEPRVESGA
jgi:ABC-2 type transport system ATP-binding protein